jgi:hypothetical protein
MTPASLAVVAKAIQVKRLLEDDGEWRSGRMIKKRVGDVPFRYPSRVSEDLKGATMVEMAVEVGAHFVFAQFEFRTNVVSFWDSLHLPPSRYGAGEALKCLGAFLTVLRGAGKAYLGCA